MRVAPVGCTISHAATTVTTANTTRSPFTIRLRCRRLPEFRALTNISEVDIFDFLRPQETRQSEQKEQKSSSNSHDLTAVSICEWKFISIEALKVPDKFCSRHLASRKSQSPRTPFERSRWRGGRFACYAPDVMPQGNAFNCDFRFSLIFLSHAKSIGCRRKKIQFP